MASDRWWCPHGCGHSVYGWSHYPTQPGFACRRCHRQFRRDELVAENPRIVTHYENGRRARVRFLTAAAKP